MRIIVGISGGIAAYKVPQLVRLLKKRGHEVQCVVTAHALEFVTKVTLETVSERRLYCDLFDDGNERTTEHISLKDWGDVLLLAPATANIIGKMANGIGDDALSTLLLSFGGKPMFVCPAMNTQMAENVAVAENLRVLEARGVRVMDYEEGELACGAVGKGRMAEPEKIVEWLEAKLEEGNSMRGKRVLITAGPTYEKIDSVRFIGNYSSGKMGFALAEEFAERGAEVTLVAGPCNQTTKSRGVRRIDVESAQEMYDAATEAFERADVAILSAAVADFRPDHQEEQKIKKQGDGGMTLKLVQNPDILATLGKRKREGQLLVGFALETNNEMAYATEKLKKKGLDMIVMNSLRDEGAGFGTDTNKVTIIDKAGNVASGELKSKREVAGDIADAVERQMENK